MNTNKIREALETALNARERDTAHDGLLREAIAELDKAPKVLTDDPVAWMSDDGEPISAAGLTVEEVDQCIDELGDPPDNPDHFWQWREKVSARLTAAMEAKTRKP